MFYKFIPQEVDIEDKKKEEEQNLYIVRVRPVSNFKTVKYVNEFFEIKIPPRDEESSEANFKIIAIVYFDHFKILRADCPTPIGVRTNDRSDYFDIRNVSNFFPTRFTYTT